jgi:hypothetical protein
VIEASEAEVEALLSRRFDDLKLLVIYIDGLIFGDYTMIGAVGVDTEARKHICGRWRNHFGHAIQLAWGWQRSSHDPKYPAVHASGGCPSHS